MERLRIFLDFRLRFEKPEIFEEEERELKPKEKKFVREITTSTLPSHLAKVPQQSNTCDCGVFLCKYVEEFLKKPFGIPIQVTDLFSQNVEVSALRIEIKNLLKSFQVPQAKSKKNEVQEISDSDSDSD